MYYDSKWDEVLIPYVRFHIRLKMDNIMIRVSITTANSYIGVSMARQFYC